MQPVDRPRYRAVVLLDQNQRTRTIAPPKPEISMPFATSCPHCDATYNLADKLLGKTIRCKQCDKAFKAVEADQPPARPAQKSKKSDAIGARKPAAATLKARDEEKPRRRRDEDDEDDRPRRRSRRAEGKKSNKGLIIGLAVGGGALLIGIIVLVIVLMGKKGDSRDSTAQDESGTKKPDDGKDGRKPDDKKPVNPNVLAANVTSGTPIDTSDWLVCERILVTPGTAVFVHRRKTEGDKACVVVYNLGTGKQTGKFDLGQTRIPQQIVLSPQAKYLAVEELVQVNPNTFERVISAWSLPDGKPVFERWKPYPSVAIGDPRYAEYQTIFMSFTEPDKLLTVTEGGRVSLWMLPEHTSVYDERPLTPGPTKSLKGPDVYSGEPTSVALSPDRLTLALRQDENVMLVDTATGKSSKTLPAPPDIGNQPLAAGMAFSPDGKRLACMFRGVYREKGFSSELLAAVWDVSQSRLVASARLPKTPSGFSALKWWGNQYVLALSGHVGETLMLSADSAKPVRQCFAPNHHRIANGTFDDQLWYADNLANKPSCPLLAFSAPAALIAKDPDSNDGTGFLKRIWLTGNGVEKQVDKDDSREKIIPKVAISKP